MEMEKEIDFVNEPEPKRFLKKEAVRGVGGMNFEFVKAIEKTMTSRNGKAYKEIEVTLKDEYGLYVLNCFRENLQFRGYKPKTVKVTVEAQDKFLNWVIKPNETA